MIDYSRLPDSLRESAKLYIEHGILPGEFLRAVISNDLFEAVGRADDFNRILMHDICSWFHCEAPGECFGCPERMEEWHAQGGLRRGAAA